MPSACSRARPCLFATVSSTRYLAWGHTAGYWRGLFPDACHWRGLTTRSSATLELEACLPLNLFTNSDPHPPARTCSLSSPGCGALMEHKEMFLPKLEKPDGQPDLPWQAPGLPAGVPRGRQGWEEQWWHSLPGHLGSLLQGWHLLPGISIPSLDRSPMSSESHTVTHSSL